MSFLAISILNDFDDDVILFLCEIESASTTLLISHDRGSILGILITFPPFSLVNFSHFSLCLINQWIKWNQLFAKMLLEWSSTFYDTVNSEIIAFIYYCDLRKFSQIEIYIIAKHEVLQYKCEV